VARKQQVVEQVAIVAEEGTVTIESTPITKATMIRVLAEGGMAISEVAKLVGVTYQHAYNTAHAAQVATGTVTQRNSEDNKSAKMREMAASGMSTSQIAKALGVRYQFVHNVTKRTK
jgi:transposase